MVGVLLLVCVVSVGLTYYSGVFIEIHPLQTADDEEIRVACVGDSITYGFLVFGWKEKNYPAQLGKLLGKGYVVNNYGYSGRTVSSNGDRPYTNEKLYKQSLEFNPDIVILMLGTNDTRTGNWKGSESFSEEYGDLIDTYLNLSSSPKVILMTPPPTYSFLGKVQYNISATLVQNEVNEAVKLLAEIKGIECIDLYAVFEGKKELYTDGVHPNARGARLIAETVYERIKWEENSLID